MTAGAGDDNANQAQRLLEALIRQREELGEIAAELISLLEAAGVNSPADPRDRETDPSPE
ncbi:MAG: hypothetical protein MZW92_45670 [Comamonadaceae bacterium]|nr:hypothetical protein [Comamonadaceae bacterium]